MPTSYTYVGQDFSDRYVKWSELDGGLYSNAFFGAGANQYGQLGVNDRNVYTNLVNPFISNYTDYIDGACGLYATYAIKTDGTLWAWGYNIIGQLGLGDTVNRSSPCQIGALNNWKQISNNGNGTTASIKTDGTLWVWGYNLYGQLGLNDRVNRSSPVQVGSLTNWAQVVSGSGHTIALKTDGTLWAWGYNFNGQLGLDDRVHRSSPVQVGSLTNWKQITAGQESTLAIKTDDTLWAWGRAGVPYMDGWPDRGGGQLGLGDLVHRSSPVQVGSLTNWKQVECGHDASNQYCFTLAIKTDGTLWSWGHNIIGQLGLNDIIHRSSPVQVGALTSWSIAKGGDNHTIAIKTDGTLWAWGNNGDSQLGLGTTNSISSPVQVGSLSNWIQCDGSRYNSIFIKG